MASVGGVWHLQRLTLRYCQHGGSSLGMRQFIRSELAAFAEANPQLEVSTAVRNSKHPVVVGEYARGDPRVVDVKNTPPENVLKVCESLRNSKGKKVAKVKYTVYSKAPSIQGEWRYGIGKNVPFKIREQ